MEQSETAQRLVGQRYRLLEPMGRGGMGTVWRGHDELLDRPVAVKQVTIPAAIEGAERDSTRDRVMREARAAARLSHPASVTVFDVLEDDGSVYIVMELVEADTLAAQVERHGPSSIEDVVRLGLNLVGALEAAHRQGIVHRDVKPANVMVLPNGTVKLTDFGIASLKDHPTLTRTGQLLGSPSYMAPEQALGQPSGEEVDWWGLGATLYFALEGRGPFERSGALATLTAVVNDEAAPTEHARAMAPLLDRMLAKEPADRPDAPELRKLLRRLAEPPQPSPAAPPAACPPRPPPARVARSASSPARQTPYTPAPVPGDGRSASTALIVGVAALALLVGLLAWSPWAGDEAPARTGSDTTVAGGDQPEPDRSPPSDSRNVPGDWVTYTDPKVGYQLAHPPGWRVRPLDGTRTDITDPATGSYLRVDWTDTPGPSPEGAWETQSASFGARHEQYREIAIEPTTYKGFDAATWEYAYSAAGARLHAVNLGMVSGAYGFALNFQTTDERWESSQDLFEAFKASFVVPD